MINLTVKTLDSQNHAFSVEDEITITEFKEKIADTVNIPAEIQRLIYCGRVLQDSAKLKDYDVDGKVIHLVQRPPPSSVLRSDTTEPQPQQPQRRVRGLEYVGTVRLPVPVSGFENTLHSLPVHSLANSRLNVARRMISRAETVLNALENPNRPEQPAATEPQEDATPVFEARVVIPNTPFSESAPDLADPLSNEPILLPTDLLSMDDTLPNPSNGADQIHSVSSTPEVATPLARSTENLAAADTESNSVLEENTAPASDADTTNSNATANDSTSARAPTGTSHTAEFADILDSLNRLQTRFATFFTQYNNFMREDPVVRQRNVRSTQAMMNRVSEVCHYLGHAYHSISDIILRVRATPPRQLLCRPMLIQHSAVVQVDIPIDVEAHINIPAARNPVSTTTTSGTSTTAASTQPSGTTTSTTATTASTEMPLNTLLGIPFMNRGGVRVETFRVPLLEGNSLLRNNNNTTGSPFRTGLNPAVSEAIATAMRAAESSRPITSTTATNSTPASAAQLPPQPMDIASAIASNVVDSLNNVTAESGSTTDNTESTGTTGAPGSSNNPVEFFMEVTPDSITIDSLETAFVGANPGNDLSSILHESINAPPPEFIQSIMQMAGQLIGRSAMGSNIHVSTSSVSSAPSSTTSTPTPSAPLDLSSAPTVNTETASVGAQTSPFQNSQARGNTQTQPTTATHTRSTPRPHVHLAQHTMHAFDPFLPCNSHHLSNRRRLQPSAGGTSQQNTPQSTTNSANVDPPDNVNSSSVFNIVHTFLSAVRNLHNRSVPTVESGASSTTNLPQADEASTNWMLTEPGEHAVDRRTTIQEIFEHFPESPLLARRNIFPDLIVLLARSLTFGELMQLANGQIEVLNGIATELRTYTLGNVLHGNSSDPGYERALSRLFGEMHIFMNQLSMLETRDNIDLVRSVQALISGRFPNLMSSVFNRNGNAIRLMFEQLRTTVQQMCALIISASRNGSESLELVLEAVLMQILEGMPEDLQEWCMQTIKPHLTTFINNLQVPESILQQYIVRHISRRESVIALVNNAEDVPQPEAMQVEEIVETSHQPSEEAMPALEASEDGDGVPTVVLGSAPWHAQVPSDWVPIIVRDTQRQRRQGSQPPFSDAYLSGMPSKRRKLTDCNKPRSSISQVISENVRRAVTTAGLAAAAPIETVTRAAAENGDLQSSYRELLHNHVQSELVNNEDFSPEQFPNVDSYFNNPRQ